MSIAAPGALIRILVVGDSPVIRIVAERMASAEEVFEVVGEAGDPDAGAALAESHLPDVILLDLAGDGDPVASIGAVVDGCPDAIVIVLSQPPVDASSLGAHASIDSDLAPDEIMRRVIDVFRSMMAAQFVGAIERAAPDADVREPFAEPMRLVVGSSEQLVNEYGAKLDDAARAMIASIVAGAHLMEDTVAGLIAHCRLDASEPLSIDVSLDDVLRAAVETVSIDIAREDATVSVDPMPWVVGDPPQLQLLFESLLSNALKFVRRGERPRVHVAAHRIQDGWRITVEDNGIGVEAAERERIFGMFVRLHPQAEFLGTGIGLASAKRIVESHAGTVRVEDATGLGSRFIVELPDRLATFAFTPEPDVDKTVEIIEPELLDDRRLNVLLVEDNPEHARLIRALLRRAPSPGYRLHHVGSSADARLMLASTDMDCVLLDLSLPDATNLEALAQVRSAATLVAIVVITSSSDEALAFAAVSQGAQDYLVKGQIDPEQLSRAIRWAVQRKTLENDLTRDALHDPLTRLPNRTLMLDRLASALARSERSSKKVAVFFMDLDGFKAVNDRFGHEAGDQFLIEMAERLRAAVRPQDTVARIGGDEFVIICEGFNSEDAEWRTLQGRLAAAVEIPMDVSGNSVRVSASVGLAIGGREYDPESILRAADAAMYAVKRSR